MLIYSHVSLDFPVCFYHSFSLAIEEGCGIQLTRDWENKDIKE
jgi:hypothetical protein